MSSHNPFTGWKLTYKGFDIPIYTLNTAYESRRPNPSRVDLTAAFDPVEMGRFLAKQSLIDFAKTGAPPVRDCACGRDGELCPASDGHTLCAGWIDDSPTYSGVLAARDAKAATRCVPRMVDQGPYVKGPIGPCGGDGGHLGKRGPTSWRPDSPSKFCLDFHASNQRWWTDLNTGEKIERNMGEMLMLVVSEIAEAMEGERKDLMDDHLPHRKMAEVELADAVIRIADIVGSLGEGYATTFDDRLKEIRGGDVALSDNKGEQLRRICIPLCGFQMRANRPHVLVNKLARAWHRIERYAAKYNYDLWGAVFEKMEYNKTRADHTPEARKAANGKKF